MQGTFQQRFLDSWVEAHVSTLALGLRCHRFEPDKLRAALRHGANHGSEISGSLDEDQQMQSFMQAIKDLAGNQAMTTDEIRFLAEKMELIKLRIDEYYNIYKTRFNPPSCFLNDQVSIYLNRIVVSAECEYRNYSAS